MSDIIYTPKRIELPDRPPKDPNRPTVSIITPNYNYGHFLENCLISVLTQSYPNIEYIVVDGGSTDCSLSLIEHYKAKGIDRYVSEKDNGQTDAINKGFAMTTGHLFAWLNSDDTYAHEHVIEEVVQHYEKGARFISGEFRSIDEHGNPFVQGQAYGDIDPVDFEECLRFWEHTCPSQPATFVDRELAEQVFPMDPSIECYMDFELFLGVLAQNPKTAWVQKQWVDFVYHGQNKSLGNFSEAYNLEREAKAVFLESAKKLSPEKFRYYRKDFNQNLMVRTIPQIPLHHSLWKVFTQYPGLLPNIHIWKAVARKLLGPRKTNTDHG